MNGLHQQIEAKRREITAAQATLDDQDASPQSSHDALERMPRLRRELEQLCVCAHKGEHAIGEMRWALNAMVNEMPVKGRELSLAITHAEDAITRLRNHLGHAAEPTPTLQAD